MSSPPPSHGEGWLTKLSPPSGHPSPRVAIPLPGTLNLSTSRYVPLLRRVLLPWVPSRYHTSCNSRGTIPRVTLVVLYLGYLSRYNTSCNSRDMLLPWDARRVCPVKSAASKCDWQGNCPRLRCTGTVSLRVSHSGARNAIASSVLEDCPHLLWRRSFCPASYAWDDYSGTGHSSRRSDCEKIAGPSHGRCLTPPHGRPRLPLTGVILSRV